MKTTANRVARPASKHKKALTQMYPDRTFENKGDVFVKGKAIVKNIEKTRINEY